MPPFDQEEMQRRFLEKLNAIPGVEMPSVAEARLPNFKMSALQDRASMGLFLEALDWFVDLIPEEK